MSRRAGAGFTLLEVLVAMVILSVAVVTLIQLASQGLRLLKVSSDYQEAVLLADRVARAGEVSIEGVETGQEGPFNWERRATLVAVPDDLAPVGSAAPRLLALSVAVRWGTARTLELATLRVAPNAPTTPSGATPSGVTPSGATPSGATPRGATPRGATR